MTSLGLCLAPASACMAYIPVMHSTKEMRIQNTQHQCNDCPYKYHIVILNYFHLSSFENNEVINHLYFEKNVIRITKIGGYIFNSPLACLDLPSECYVPRCLDMHPVCIYIVGRTSKELVKTFIVFVDPPALQNMLWCSLKIDCGSVFWGLFPPE